jgi:hypothetical protein
MAALGRSRGAPCRVRVLARTAHIHVRKELLLARLGDVEVELGEELLELGHVEQVVGRLAVAL